MWKSWHTKEDNGVKKVGIKREEWYNKVQMDKAENATRKNREE